MKKLNVILVYNKDMTKILMCKRTKEPYKGKYNLVGGKIEENESNIDAAYRELYEETSITKNDICIKPLMNFEYLCSEIELQVYAGILNKDVDVIDEVNKLYWIDANSNFYDLNTYAGEGNIEHMVERFKMFKDKLFNK